MSATDPRVKVRIYTPNYRIHGEIAQFAGERLTDYMVSAKPFLAVTRAEVYGSDGRQLFSSRFLNVQRDRIELIVPEEEVREAV